MDDLREEEPNNKTEENANTNSTAKSSVIDNKTAQTKSYIGRTLKENSSKVVGNEKSYKDLYTYHADMRAEQLASAQTVTEILKNYNNQQKDRNDYKKVMRHVLFWLLMAVILGLTICIIVFVSKIVINEITTEAIIGIVSAGVTYLGSLLTILIVIVKYIFPEDEDKNFHNLLTTIVDNDTERIKDDNEKEG